MPDLYCIPATRIQTNPRSMFLLNYSSYHCFIIVREVTVMYLFFPKIDHSVKSVVLEKKDTAKKQSLKGLEPLDLRDPHIVMLY